MRLPCLKNSSSMFSNNTHSKLYMYHSSMCMYNLLSSISKHLKSLTISLPNYPLFKLVVIMSLLILYPHLHPLCMLNNNNNNNKPNRINSSQHLKRRHIPMTQS